MLATDFRDYDMMRRLQLFYFYLITTTNFHRCETDRDGRTDKTRNAVY